MRIPYIDDFATEKHSGRNIKDIGEKTSMPTWEKMINPRNADEYLEDRLMDRTEVKNNRYCNFNKRIKRFEEF